MPSYVMILRMAWHQSGLSAAQIGARCGVSPNTVYLVMNGRRKVRVDSVLAIASALGVSALPVPRDDFPTSSSLSA